MISFELFGIIVTEGHLISNGLMHLLPASCERKEVKSLHQNYNLGVINEIQFWQALGLTDYQQLQATFINNFKLDAEFALVANQLKSEYQLSILSNVPSDWADELAARFEFEKLFNLVMFSGHLKCKKSQAGIYYRLIAQSQLRSD